MAGQNTLWANLVPVIFAVFVYFPTLVEVPVAQTFLALGMHRGPLLAYLLADPASDQAVLIDPVFEQARRFGLHTSAHAGEATVELSLVPLLPGSE